MKGDIAEVYRGSFKSIYWVCIKYMQNCHNNNCGELSLCLFISKYKLKEVAFGLIFLPQSKEEKWKTKV